MKILEKKNEITYKELELSDLNDNMLEHFDRYQEVEKYYSHEGDTLEVKDCDFVENWDNDKKLSVIHEDFHEVIESGGKLFGAFDNDKLIGFSCYDGTLFGSKSQYMQLILIQVSNGYRGKGIGKKLFSFSAVNAKEKVAKKLYISANSSYSTQQFYRSIGCVDVTEVVKHLCDEEPFYIQMEYIL